MRFEDFGCERRMSRDKIGVVSWCLGLGGPEGLYFCEESKFILIINHNYSFGDGAVNLSKSP